MTEGRGLIYPSSIFLISLCTLAARYAPFDSFIHSYYCYAFTYILRVTSHMYDSTSTLAILHFEEVHPLPLLSLRL